MGNQSEFHSNVIFVFIPFRYEISEHFGESMKQVRSAMEKTEGVWNYTEDKMSYLLRFVTDKIVGNDPDRRQCLHFMLNRTPEAWEEAGLGVGTKAADQWYRAETDLTDRGEKVPIRFQILNVHSYLFSTGVGILGYELTFQDRNPDDSCFDARRTAALLYRMKKAKMPFVPEREEQPGDTKSISLLISASRLMKNLITDQDAFFFFANQEQSMSRRANIMALICLPGSRQEDDPILTPQTRHDFYYLRHCYHEGFHYVEDRVAEEHEIFSLSREIIWGVSSEAMIAAVYPDTVGEQDLDFIKGTFYRNFTIQYLFMYVFLLHQKFALYQFLTEIGRYKDMTIEKLQNYSLRLYHFETDFEYSRVTDVPQYQVLYERQLLAMGNEQLFKDVKEPLEALQRERRRAEEVAQQAAENAANARESRMNRILSMVGILAIFSAWVDSFDFVDEAFEKLGWSFMTSAIQILLFSVILIVAGFAIREFAGQWLTPWINQIRSGRKKDRESSERKD